MWDKWINTSEGKGWHYWWHFVKPREDAAFHRRWGIPMKRDDYPNNKWCLTCNAPESMIALIPDGKGFMVLPNFYGRWNYCHCPRSIIDQSFLLGTLPPRPGVNLTRRSMMAAPRWLINFEFPVQESDEKTKKEMVVAYSNCEVSADTLDEALASAKELLPQVCEGFVITGVAVVLES